MPASRPNVLIITTHDSGRHFGCYGVPTVQTPSIDALAAEGVQFNRMFAAGPICSPSRGALLTGRYPLANGLVGLVGGSWNWELNDYKQHLSWGLKENGYHTRMFGLQHETSDIERLGFDDHSAHGIRRGEKQRNASTLAGDVADFLETCSGETPFYAQVGFFETHTSYSFADCDADDHNGVWIPPYAKTHAWPAWASVLNRFGGDPAFARQHVAELQGALREADRGVGTILQALEASGQADNTIVLFNTDHGPELPGAKWTMYDAGLGIAFIMRWPDGGVTGGRQCDWMLGNVDFLPTLDELLGLEPPDDTHGVSFAKACREDVGDQPSPREVAYGNWVDGLNFSVRTTRFKLIRNIVPVDSTGRECPDCELYDLEIDPLELTDVAREPAYADDLAHLQELLDAWLRKMDDPTVHDLIVGDDHNAMLADYRAKYEKSRGIG